MFYGGIMISMTPFIILLSFILVSCGGSSGNYSGITERPQQQSQESSGKDTLRFETFGNEGFWTDAARLPQGIVKAKLTPVQALKAGLSVNTDALDAATLTAVANEIKTNGTSGPILNSFATTVKLLNANAVIGVVVKDTNGDGKLDVATGDKVGVSCVLCHAITDKSGFDLPSGGSIGKEIDGPAAHTLQVGKILALADNTRAFYPNAQLKGANGKSIGRAPSDKGLTKTSTEAEFDAYFSNPAYYPVGTFDDTVDGNGNSMHNTPLFRQDLAAPFGSAGELERFDQFANTVYTVLFDPTNLLTPGGRAFLKVAAGEAAGTQLANDYAEVLKATGVTNYPYVKGSTTGAPGNEDTLIGIRVDESQLQNEVQYVNALRSPPGVVKDAPAIARGRVHFNSALYGCTTCHNSDNSQPVSTTIIPMKTIFPGDAPVVLANRLAPVTGPVSDTPGSTFDDKMIVINATLRGSIRGTALPLLMDLARKPVFLHDNSLKSLKELLSSSRGATAPHPFYVKSADQDDLIQYLDSLDDKSN
jgi:mono/diheme cytochrome c family protein